MQSVALISGAGRGIGRAAAIELAAAGFTLALLSRSKEQLQQTAQIAGSGLVLPTDVTVPQQVEAAITQTERSLGRIDAIVHCAGVAPLMPLHEMQPEQWHQVIDTNLSAAFYLSRSVWPIFRRQRSGVIVNISSEASRDPFPGLGAYGAAKAGLNLLGLALAREGHAIGVRAYTIAPGAVETAMFRQIMPIDQYPTEKTLDPRDVAKVVVQCIAGDLRFCSGEVVYMHKLVRS